MGWSGRVWYAWRGGSGPVDADRFLPHPRRQLHDGSDEQGHGRRCHADHGDGQPVLHSADRDDQGAMGRGEDVGGKQWLHGSADGRRQGGQSSGADGDLVGRGEMVQCAEREGGIDASLHGARRGDADRDDRTDSELERERLPLANGGRVGKGGTRRSGRRQRVAA